MRPYESPGSGFRGDLPRNRRPVHLTKASTPQQFTGSLTRSPWGQPGLLDQIDRFHHGDGRDEDAGSRLVGLSQGMVSGGGQLGRFQQIPEGGMRVGQNGAHRDSIAGDVAGEM